MSVSSRTYSVDFRGLELWFCSSQCQGRFNQRPNLFIGDPQHGKAAKQQGVKVKKRRKLQLDLPDSVVVQEGLISLLKSLMGVEHVTLFSNTLEIEYDLLQVSLEDIEKAISEMNLEVDQSWINKLRDAFTHLNERTELDSLGHPSKGNGYH